MVVRDIEGLTLCDDIENFVVEAELLGTKSDERGWVKRYFLPEHGIHATFRTVYNPERRTLTRLKGPEDKVDEIVDYLALFSNSDPVQ